MSEGPKTHWAVTNRTYPNGDTVTEFEFGNGVTIQYDPSVGGLYVYLPVKELIQSTCSKTTRLRDDDQIFVSADYCQGNLAGVEIVRAETKFEATP